MLEAAGYFQDPPVQGALTRVAKKTGVPHPTLSRWARAVQNPPPSDLVQSKKKNLVELMENEIREIFARMGIEREEATYRELGTVMGIIFDKMQLLTGGPTENINQRVLVLDFGDVSNGNGNGRTVSD